MNMSNVLLIVLAILLLWGAINLDRSSQFRVVEDTNSQLNDSIEFLRKLKGKSAREESDSRRIDAYRETVNKAANENPESLNRIEKDFNQGTEANSSAIKNLIFSTESINSTLKEIEALSNEIDMKNDLEAKAAIDNLTKLYQTIQNVQMSSGEFTKQSAVLAQNIAEVKDHLA